MKNPTLESILYQLQYTADYLERAKVNNSNIVSMFRELLSTEFLVDKAINGGLTNEALNAVLLELKFRQTEHETFSK